MVFISDVAHFAKLNLCTRSFQIFVKFHMKQIVVSLEREENGIPPGLGIHVVFNYTNQRMASLNLQFVVSFQHLLFSNVFLSCYCGKIDYFVVDQTFLFELRSWIWQRNI